LNGGHTYQPYVDKCLAESSSTPKEALIIFEDYSMYKRQRNAPSWYDEKEVGSWKDKAVELKQILEQGYNFNVKLLENPTHYALQQELQQYCFNKSQSEVFIYIAGHSVNEGSGNYFLTNDITSGGDYNGHGKFAHSNILDYFTRSNAKKTLLFMQTCFSGAMFNIPPYNTRLERITSSKPLRDDMLFSVCDIPSKILITSSIDNIESDSKLTSLFNNILKTNKLEHKSVESIFYDALNLGTGLKTPAIGKQNLTGSSNRGTFIFSKR